MKQLKAAQPGAPRFLDLNGPLNLKTISAAHGQLVAALAASADLTLRLDADPTADLTLVQLIESARRSARAQGGALTLARPAEGGLLDTLKRGGFLETPDQREFWLNRPAGPQ